MEEFLISRKIFLKTIKKNVIHKNKGCSPIDIFDMSYAGVIKPSEGLREIISFRMTGIIKNKEVLVDPDSSTKKIEIC